MRKPKFVRQRSHHKKRVKPRWRRPRGIDSKQRKGVKAKGARPRIGYGSPRKKRGLHGKVREVLVRNILDLEKASKGDAIRISSQVGRKKREKLVKEAISRGIHVINEK